MSLGDELRNTINSMQAPQEPQRVQQVQEDSFNQYGQQPSTTGEHQMSNYRAMEEENRALKTRLGTLYEAASEGDARLEEQRVHFRREMMKMKRELFDNREELENARAKLSMYQKNMETLGRTTHNVMALNRMVEERAQNAQRRIRGERAKYSRHKMRSGRKI